MRLINNDTALKSKYGQVAIADVHYHVVRIRRELENAIDYDGIDKYVAEYSRFQNAIDQEIEDVEETIKLLDMEKQAETWIKLKRLKKELMENKLKSIQDAELPLLVKKIKRERNQKLKTLNVTKEVEDLR